MPQVAPLRSDDPKRVGRYRLTGRVPGLPGSSRAYLGRATDGDRVTLTMLGTDRTPDGAARDRFTAEARAARRVAPFCVARILDAGVEGGHAYLVTEFVAGPLLSETVAASGPRTGAELEALAIGMATGLAAVHQAGLVHGEFGPAHVVLGTEGPRVIGFAITPPYGKATPAADMLAWAQTVLFAGSGGNPPGAALASLPESLRGIVASCIAPEPSARPAARQVVVRLIGHESPQAGVLAEGSRRAAKAAMRAPAEPAAGVVRPPAAGRRRRSRIVGTAAAATVCVLAIAVAVHVLQDASSNRGHAVNPDSAQPARRIADRLPVRVAVIAAAGHAPGRGGGHLVGISPAGQRQHRHPRQAQRELAGRHDQVLRYLVYLLGQAHPGGAGEPRPADEPGDCRRRLPGRRGHAHPAARRLAQVQLQGRFQPRRHRHPDQAIGGPPGTRAARWAPSARCRDYASRSGSRPASRSCSSPKSPGPAATVIDRLAGLPAIPSTCAPASAAMRPPAATSQWLRPRS